MSTDFNFFSQTTSVSTSILDDNAHRFVQNHVKKLKSLQFAYEQRPSNLLRNEPVFKVNDLGMQSTGLLNTSNSSSLVFDKLFKTLYHTVQKLESLLSKGFDHFLPKITLYDDELDEEKIDASLNNEGFVQIQMSEFLPILKDLNTYIYALNEVGVYFVRQLSLFYSKNGFPVSADGRSRIDAFNKSNGDMFFSVFSRLLCLFIELDVAIKRNTKLYNGFLRFHNLVKASKLEPNRYGTTLDAANTLDSVLDIIKVGVFDFRIFATFLESQFTLPQMTKLSKNTVFQNHLTTYINFRFTLFDMSKMTSNSLNFVGQYLGLLGLIVFNMTLSPLPSYPAEQDNPLLRIPLSNPVSNKMLRDYFNFEKLFPYIPLCGGLEFVFSFYISELTGYPAIMQNMQTHLMTRENYDAFTDNMLHFSDRTQIFQMLLDAHKITEFKTLEFLTNVKTMAKLHVYSLLMWTQLLNTQFKRRVYNGMLDCIGLIKYKVRLPFKSHLDVFTEIRQQIADVLSGYLDKLMSGRKLELYSAFCLIIQAVEQFNGNYDMIEMLFSLISFHLSNSDRKFVENQLFIIKFTSVIETTVHRLQDLSLLIRFKDYFGVLLQVPPEKQIKKEADGLGAVAYNLGCVFQGLNDIFSLKVHSNNTVKFEQHYFDVMKVLIDEKIVEPLAEIIEVDLRFHTSFLLDILPVYQGEPLNLDPFLDIRETLASSIVDIRSLVSSVISQRSYNHIVLQSHQYFIFRFIRHLARSKYNLEVFDSQLPPNTLDQTLDVLEIMRNINSFVTAHNYSLSGQFFISKIKTKNKYIQTLTLNHISNSVRVHGVGVLNSTVNFIYSHFLIRKLRVLGQFLMDDYVRSRLMREMKDYDTTEPYEYGKAEKVIKDIRGLDTSLEGRNPIDRLMDLVTAIGNALGFVRMLHVGGLDVMGHSKRMTIPEKPEGLGHAGERAYEVLQSVISQLSDNFDYLPMLCSIFQEEFSKSSHLELFLYLTPALLVSHVAHMIKESDLLFTKSMVGAEAKAGSFVNDGFALGLCFVLNSISIERAFYGMHFFDEVSKNFQIKNGDSELRKDIKRKTMEQWEHVRLCMNSSGLFFFDERTSHIYEK
ncbi:hypothetical protein PCE1_002133 [Barthelona sp. PCE]